MIELINSCSVEDIEDKIFPSYLYYESLKMQHMHFSRNIFSFFNKEPLEDTHLLEKLASSCSPSLLQEGNAFTLLRRG
jgi:hypothetical protein